MAKSGTPDFARERPSPRAARSRVRVPAQRSTSVTLTRSLRESASPVPGEEGATVAPFAIARPARARGLDPCSLGGCHEPFGRAPPLAQSRRAAGRDRKSTRLNSRHLVISYAAFCLKKKTYKR